jgi:hypothetical protein
MAKDKQLTGKQRLFVEFYLIHLNATKAAELAGYQGDYGSLRVIGHENLTKVNIRSAIDKALAERVMGKHEVLSRLAEHARTDMGDFITIKHGLPFFDLEKAEEAAKLRLIKKFKNSENGIELELYDAQAALVHLGKYHKLFTDRIQTDDWRTQAIDDIKAGRIDYHTLAEAFDNDLATELFRTAGVPISR